MDVPGTEARFPLNIFLIRQGHELQLDTANFSRSMDIDVGAEAPVRLYYGHTLGRPPWLVKLSRFSISPAFQLPEVGSVSGLFHVRIKDRDLVLTFGHAWQKMRSKPIEPNFGIRCVLNLAEENALRAIRRDRVADETLQAIEQIPGSDGIERFGLDVEKDILRGVKASVSGRSGFGVWIAGSDSFKASVDLSAESIFSFLLRVLDVWAADKYKENFDWIDNISPVRDEHDISTLNTALVEELLENPDKFSLCSPELLSWDDFDFFSFERKKTGQAPCANHMDISHWLSCLRYKYGQVTSKEISESQIFAYSADGIRKDQWPALSCVNGVLSLDAETYLTHAGNWYRVSEDFVERIDRRVESIEVSNVRLPSVELREKEGDYNSRVAAIEGSPLLLMDKKLINYGGGRSKLEVCDLFTDDGHLICVKPWGNASESLSHLFLQARHTVTLINNDEAYRGRVKEYIAGLDAGYAIIWDCICEDTKDAELVLAVLRGCPKEKLPFFAKLSLVGCVDELRKMRFKCTYISVPVAQH
ncbi:DUF6119 family protein [Xanthomonas graminis]|uniref:DUF6119 family protein n=1 Tax=Xanthomonas graminis TaxID=3390026 RepID=UPI0009BD2A5E|nr:DUF6119 family protein [Xanthomonas translucens]